MTEISFVVFKFVIYKYIKNICIKEEQVHRGNLLKRSMLLDDWQWFAKKILADMSLYFMYTVTNQIKLYTFLVLSVVTKFEVDA